MCLDAPSFFTRFLPVSGVLPDVQVLGKELSTKKTAPANQPGQFFLYKVTNEKHLDVTIPCSFNQTN
jgi:hypothetical protein